MVMVLPAIGASFHLACQQGASSTAFSNPACPAQEREWSKDQLTEIALSGIERGNYEVEEVRTQQEGCRIYVSVRWRPLVPGGHLVVVVSAVDGTILEVMGGL